MTATPFASVDAWRDPNVMVTPDSFAPLGSEIVKVTGYVVEFSGFRLLLMLVEEVTVRLSVVGV